VKHPEQPEYRSDFPGDFRGQPSREDLFEEAALLPELRCRKPGLATAGEHVDNAGPGLLDIELFLTIFTRPHPDRRRAAALGARIRHAGGVARRNTRESGGGWCQTGS